MFYFIPLLVVFWLLKLELANFFGENVFFSSTVLFPELMKVTKNCLLPSKHALKLVIVAKLATSQPLAAHTVWSFDY